MRFGSSQTQSLFSLLSSVAIDCLRRVLPLPMNHLSIRVIQEVGGYLYFGASEPTSFSKRGSERNEILPDLPIQVSCSARLEFFL
jgi:hypothetical protein